MTAIDRRAGPTFYKNDCRLQKKLTLYEVLGYLISIADRGRLIGNSSLGTQRT